MSLWDIRLKKKFVAEGEPPHLRIEAVARSRASIVNTIESFNVAQPVHKS